MKSVSLRHLRTTAERRANQECWHRGRRSMKLLLDSWDDIPRISQRTWKKHRRTQYHGRYA